MKQVYTFLVCAGIALLMPSFVQAQLARADVSTKQSNATLTEGPGDGGRHVTYRSFSKLNRALPIGSPSVVQPVNALIFAPLALPGVSAGAANNMFIEGTGDGGDLTTYNTFLKLHSGMAIGSPYASNGSGGYVEKATIAFNGRSGNIRTLGNFIALNGKLGLGVVEPVNTLDVLTPFAASTETIAFVGQDHNYAANTGRYGVGLSFQHVDGTSAGKKAFLNIWFGNELKRAMSFNYLGFVGIGCTNPDTRLTVKGIIHTDEVRVDLLSSICPDYVFEPDYKLISLEELEQYLKQNKHLPEVPSAKEMEDNGLYLREMNLLLLKKIEELTLHAIALNKENVSLKNENDQVSQQVTAINERLAKLEAIASKLK